MRRMTYVYGRVDDETSWEILSRIRIIMTIETSHIPIQCSSLVIQVRRKIHLNLTSEGIPERK